MRWFEISLELNYSTKLGRGGNFTCHYDLPAKLWQAGEHIHCSQCELREQSSWHWCHSGVSLP